MPCDDVQQYRQVVMRQLVTNPIVPSGTLFTECYTSDRVRNTLLASACAFHYEQEPRHAADVLLRITNLRCSRQCTNYVNT